MDIREAGAGSRKTGVGCVKSGVESKVYDVNFERTKK